MPAESDRRLAAVLMVVLWVLAEAVPAAAAPLTSADDLATSSSTGATTPSTDQQLLDSLPEEERVAVMAYELAAALQRLAEQVAAGGEDDVTEQARIVERGDGEEAAAAGPAMLHRALHAASAARTISLSQKFHSILNRWALATSNATDYKVMKVRAKITICFPFNVCFQIEDPWSLCCPF